MGVFRLNLRRSCKSFLFLILPTELLLGRLNVENFTCLTISWIGLSVSDLFVCYKLDFSSSCNCLSFLTGFCLPLLFGGGIDKFLEF